LCDSAEIESLLASVRAEMYGTMTSFHFRKNNRH